MLMLRTTGLLCAAFLTMGSGGVAKAPDGEASGATVLEPEYVDAETAAGASDAGSEPRVSASSSDQPSLVPVPITAEEMVGSDEGKAAEVELSDDYIQGRYYIGSGILGFENTINHVGAYFSDNRDIIANVGVMSKRVPLFIPGLTLSAGGRGYLALLSDPDDDVVGLAPGVQGRYGLPYKIGFPLAAVASIFYSPDVLTLGDAQDIVDIDLRVEGEVIPDIVGFVGYREFRFDNDIGSDKEAASEFMVGARFTL